ncbi:unnamed protein product, partial [Ixodes pacificus]
QIDKLQEDTQRDAEKKVMLERKIDELTRELENHRISIDSQNKSFYEMKKRKDTLQGERNELWRHENALQQNLATLKEELSKKDQGLRSMTGKATLNGRDSVRKVLQTFRDKGGSYEQIANNYYGMLIENFDCEKTIYTAVEVTSGNKLFYHIVDSDRIGTKILQEMNRQQLPGEVTFMPLNRLMYKDVQYPNSNDAIPMISKLNFDSKFESAMKYIYGKTLICRNLEVATQIARTSNLDCITLDGKQVVSHKGALTGGYFDTRRSRLDLHKAHMQLVKEITEVEKQLAEHKQKLSDILYLRARNLTESQINQVVSDMQKAETKNSKNKDVFDKLKADIRLMKEELTALERSKQPKERSLASLDSSLKSMESTEQSLRSELQQDLLTQLSVADQQEVDRLNDEIRRLTQENKEAFSERMRLEAEKNKLENLLNNNLYRRKEELEAALQEISVEDRRRKLENSQAELISVNARIGDVNTNLKALEKQVEGNNKEQKELQSQLENWKSQERDWQERINDDAKDLEKMTSRQSLLLKK